MKGDTLMKPEEIDEFEKNVEKAKMDLEEYVKECLLKNQVP